MRKSARYLSVLMALLLACPLFAACRCSIPAHVTLDTPETEVTELSSHNIESLPASEDKTAGNDHAKEEPKPSSDGSMQMPEPSKVQETSQEPATQTPVTQAPETKAPETKAPETKAPETKAPETQPATEAPAPQHQHSYQSKVTKQPTCQETGVKTYTCSCGDTYTETIPKTDHNYVEKKEETVVTVTDSEGFTIEVSCCIPRYCSSYKHNENGTWDFLGTWEETVQFGLPQQQYFYAVPSNYAMPNGHNSNEVLTYMRNAGYIRIYENMDAAVDACDRWLRCIGEFSDGPKNPDHGFREHYGPNWWEDGVAITVPASTHQETVSNTYYECSVCGHRK